MKTLFNLKYVIAAALFLFTTVSCDDFLDTPPADLLGSEGFYQSPSQSEQGIIGIYAGLRYMSDDSYLHLSEFRSDNVWTEPLPNALRDFAEISTFRAGDDLVSANNAWNRWYKVIYDANVALVKIAGCDFGSNEAMKEQFLGEAHFLRGWAYFELVRLFGNVPLIDTPMSPADVKKVPQSSTQDIYDKIIIPDLTTAKAKLPTSDKMVDSRNNSIAKVGRADKIAAQAMLARVYMAKAGFPLNDNASLSLAETELKAVIVYAEANGKYWAPDSTEWKKQWIPSDEYYNKYSIFAIQYRSGGSGNPALFNFSYSLPPSYTGRRIFGNDIFVEKSLMYEFDRIFTVNGETHRDSRGYNHSILTGYDEEPNFPQYTQTTEKLTLADGSQVDVFTRTMFYKFMPSKRKLAELNMSIDIEGSMTGDQDWPVNLPIIRYEDVLLMYAEIQAGKNVSEAMKIVNRIRERAGCAPETASSADEALKYIKRERRIELMGEGVRWYDLIRWNEWQTAIKNMYDRYNNPNGVDKNNVKDGRYLYAIPRNQMNVSPGLYQQNTGY